MDDVMIGRVAEALWNTNPVSTEDGMQPDDFLESARAAIEAMAEPSEQMLVVGSAYTDSDYTQAKACWQAMIANALAPITPPDTLTR